MPEAPMAPYTLMKDGTVEGIRSGFRNGRSTQGVFTAEAACMLSGYGMSKDNRQKTTAAFNDLWDTGEFSVSRALEGRIQMYGKRLSAHWLIQPDAARASLSDHLMTAIGFWPRFLVAWPESPPPRKAWVVELSKSNAIVGAWDRFNELLHEPVPGDCDTLKVIEFTDRALKEIVCPAFERFEIEAKTEGGMFQAVRPFALRSTEHLCRIAGILAVIDGADEIDTDAARRAYSLVSYSTETWRAMSAEREDSEADLWAITLFDWLADHGGVASETAMLRRGPKRYALRSAARRDAALSVLEMARLVDRMGTQWFITDGRKNSPDVRPHSPDVRPC